LDRCNILGRGDILRYVLVDDMVDRGCLVHYTNSEEEYSHCADRIDDTILHRHD
jgi:hypothetical protein